MKDGAAVAPVHVVPRVVGLANAENSQESSILTGGHSYKGNLVLKKDSISLKYLDAELPQFKP